MVYPCTRAGLHLAMAFAGITVLGAAAPVEPGVIAPLAPSAYDDAVVPVSKTLTARVANYQAAPMPDHDVDGPPEAARTSASVGPKFLSQKSLFQGDGYYYASSEQSTLDSKRAGVPGLGVSVPVK